MQPRTSKNIALEYMMLHLLLYASFSLKQTQFLNLTQYFLRYWIFFVTVCLRFYFLITDILRILKFIQCLYPLFKKVSKVLMRFNVLFFEVLSLKIFLLCIIFHETFSLVNDKNNSDVKNSMKFVHALQEMRNSLHVRRNF